MRCVDLRGYEPGRMSPSKPSDMHFPDCPDVAHPALMTRPVSGGKVPSAVEQLPDRVINRTTIEGTQRISRVLTGE